MTSRGVSSPTTATTAETVTVVGVLNPLLAAVAMATSSLLVVGNSVRTLGS